MNRKDYHRDYCRKWYDKNKEKIRERQRQYSKDNPAKRILYNAKLRAKQKGIPFDIDETDIVIPDICPILGIALFKSPGPHPCSNSPSLDKINPLLGYTKGNVQIISHRANVMKNDASREELEKFARWVMSTNVPDS